MTTCCNDGDLVYRPSMHKFYFRFKPPVSVIVQKIQNPGRHLWTKILRFKIVIFSGS